MGTFWFYLTFCAINLLALKEMELKW